MARIAVDARPLSIPTTGIGRYTQAVLDRLLDSEHEWFLYSDRPLKLDYGTRTNVQVRTGRLKAAKFGSIYAQLQFPRWSRQDQVDLYWSPRHHLPLLISSAVPQVVTIHDLVWKLYPETMSRFGHWLERVLMPPSIRAASAVIAVSDATATDVAQHFPVAAGRLRTIYEAPFLPIFEGRRPEGNYFLFVGTIEPRKNLFRLLEAYSRYLRLVAEPLPLKICGGSGWGLPELEDKLRVLGITDHVEVLGYVEDNQLPSLYRNARALLLPSLYEGFGLPIVEAFSQGTPVMTSSRGAMQEVAGDAGVLVDPECVDGMARCLAELTGNTARVRNLQSLALDRAKQFSWDRAAEQTLELMNSLL
ncbi:glycosyltransferase family 4 protein [Microbulbifer sp. SA54]|uniref:glycosyltransferase family 4 protein n=1 Tax=Microbulbifer sp. SA54 TaxID=3401577 RepID=UPI003AACA23B